MAVHVDEMVSDITTEPETQTSAPGAAAAIDNLEQLRDAHARLAADRWRTAATEYDD
ncbi:MAG: hypothetical protein ACKV2V_25590 [Blastocatellia bacterium]